jgi:hypothetical protein
MAKRRGKKNRENLFKEFATQSPGLSILSDHALARDEATSEGFELCYRIGPVYDIIRHPDTKMPMTIAIYGDWGSGKTSAMRWLHGLLDEWNESGPPDGVKVRPVWFYPWKYDNKEDVRRGLIAEVILNAIDVKNASIKTVISAAKKFGLFLGKGFLHTLASVKLKAKTPDGANEAELDLAAIKEILAEYQQAAHPEKAYLNEFEETLRDWVKDTVGKDGANERMVIFIDDLDRCMPDIALQVLEALKLYLNIDNLIFIVGVDRTVVDRLVVEHYRKLGLVRDKQEDSSPEEEAQRKIDERKARNYLAKMFQVEVNVAPSEQQIEDLLDKQLENIDYWKQLKPFEKDIFRSLIAKEARRNPREIKRLINSALIGGVGALMLSGEDESTHSEMTFAQGLQLFFIEKILTDRYAMGAKARSNRGIAFFTEWSQIVRKGRAETKDFPHTVKVPSSFNKEITEDMDLEEKTQRRMEKTFASFAPEPYHDLLKNQNFSSLLALLAAEDLGSLMQIEYQPETAQRVAIVTGTTKDSQIIREAIARQFDKKPDELTDEDYMNVIKLDMSRTELSNLTSISDLTNLQFLDLGGTQVVDVSPLKGLTSRRYLYLRGTLVADVSPLKGLTSLESLELRETQVVDVPPLKGLTSLRELWFGGCPNITDQQIAELKKALPNCSVNR